MKTAVIGSGIAGLTAALHLSERHEVTLFEAAPRAGGHAHTVDISLDGARFAVDTGFLVYNERTYPRLIELLQSLDVPVARSEMSLGLSVAADGIEWSGTSLRSVFSQPANLLRPEFYRMLLDVVRFNREATRAAKTASASASKPGSSDELLDRRTLDQFLADGDYGRAFRDWYLLPMAAAIWSCPVATMRKFPIATFARFCHNHGLLQITGRPQWYTIAGGSRQYVERIIERIKARRALVRLATPVRSISRSTGAAARSGAGEGSDRVTIATDAGKEAFDNVVLACHSDQALALLADPDALECAVLGAIGFQANRAWLHTDQRLMPVSRRAWSAWNCLSRGPADAPSLAVTYWLNRLQPLPVSTPLFVTLNPDVAPESGLTHAIFEYRHPVFDAAALTARSTLPSLQGRRSTWFCGAWTGYGFHEDGCRSGLEVAQAMLAQNVGAAQCAPSRDGARETLSASSVRFGFGEVRHARRHPVDHRFRYRAFFLRLRVDRPLEPRMIRIAGIPIFGIGRAALISFRARDHGDGSGDLPGWIRSTLAGSGLAIEGPVWLHCFSRVLGYGFKPVSFWFCHGADDRLVAVLVEVNNTFGERHIYLIDDQGRPIRAGAAYPARKVFHVSPFMHRGGEYCFRFMLSADRSIARIDYTDPSGAVLETSLSGRFEHADRKTSLRALVGYPLFGLLVIGRIHWHALCLWWQRVPFVPKPAPPAESVSRRLGSPLTPPGS